MTECLQQRESRNVCQTMRSMSQSFTFAGPASRWTSKGRSRNVETGGGWSKKRPIIDAWRKARFFLCWWWARFVTFSLSEYHCVHKSRNILLRLIIIERKKSSRTRTLLFRCKSCIEIMKTIFISITLLFACQCCTKLECQTKDPIVGCSWIWVIDYNIIQMYFLDVCRSYVHVVTERGAALDFTYDFNRFRKDDLLKRPSQGRQRPFEIVLDSERWVGGIQNGIIGCRQPPWHSCDDLRQICSLPRAL